MNACSRDYYAVEMCSRTLPRPYFTSVNWHTFSYFFLLLLPLFYHCSENMPTRYKKPSRSHFIKMFNFLILLFFFLNFLFVPFALSSIALMLLSNLYEQHFFVLLAAVSQALPCLSTHEQWDRKSLVSAPTDQFSVGVNKLHHYLFTLYAVDITVICICIMCDLVGWH